jgi:hypothetical protein
MKLSDQVCSLELAKKLKEMGIKQESLFVWEYYDENCYAIKYFPYSINNKMTDIKIYGIELYSAFTSSELGEMLPDTIPYDKHYKLPSKLDICKSHDNRWFVSYSYSSDFYLPPVIASIDDKEADALAKVLIYLIENNLLDIAYGIKRSGCEL